jgi:hypothetical protein
MIWASLQSAVASSRFPLLKLNVASSRRARYTVPLKPSVEKGLHPHPRTTAPVDVGSGREFVCPPRSLPKPPGTSGV